MEPLGEVEEEEDPDAEGKGPMAQEWPDDKMPSDYQAQCYLERYKDLGHAIGGWDLTKAKMHWMEKGRYEGRWLKPCGLGKATPFGKEEMQCYKERYHMQPGVQRAKTPAQAFKHYEKTGRKWGLNRFCAPRITFWQSYCMLARSPDLQAQFGSFLDKPDVTDFRLMRYWQQFGYFEGRDASCGDFGGELSKCANEGESCTCPHGHVYFGRPGKRGVKFTPQRMLEESHQIVDTRSLPNPEAPVKCSRETLGYVRGGPKDKPAESFLLGPAGKDMACYCQSVPKLLFEPMPCADEGGNCQCQGNVFFGASAGAEPKRSEAFSNMLDAPYAFKRAPATGNVTCTQENFPSEFPLHDTAK